MYHRPGAGATDARVAAGRPEFADFRADDEVAGRPAVTYREVRLGRVVRWVVLLDGVTRISIGCQTFDPKVLVHCNRSNTPEQINTIVKAITENVALAQTAAEVASDLGMSESRFSRFFRRHTHRRQNGRPLHLPRRAGRAHL